MEKHVRLLGFGYRSRRTKIPKPTFLEIARRAGVGTATVERVLNGRGGVGAPFARSGSASWGGIFGTGFAIDPANQLICLFFSQDFADTSSKAAAAGPTPPRPAAELQSEVLRLVWTALA